MNLVASLVVRNELGRFLVPCIEHLRAFCDTVVVLDDASADGTNVWLINHPDERIIVWNSSPSSFFEHEGRTRQRLLDYTLAQNPTHVLSIDADEFISDGPALRALLERQPDVPVWALNMEEIWNADQNHLSVREDGGWRTHPLSVLWKAPPAGTSWRMLDKKLACRRVPREVLAQKARDSGVEVLHFGWSDASDRQRRYDRYARHDGGRFHASRHLDSILWKDARVKLRTRPWPPALANHRDEIIQRVSPSV